MLPLVALALALVVGVVVLEAVSYRALERIPSVATEEFPEIDRELLGKFSSFDPELGWVPQPDREKQKDTGDHLPGEELRSVVTYSTDEYASRVCPAKERDPDADRTVSTYGDSYCFCREVDNDETFQNYLAQELDTHVANYGGETTGSIRRSCGSNASIPTTRPTTSSWSSPPHRSPASSASGNTIRSSATFSRSNPDTSSRTATSSASRVPSTRRRSCSTSSRRPTSSGSTTFTISTGSDRTSRRGRTPRTSSRRTSTSGTPATRPEGLERRLGRSVPGIDFDLAQTQSALRLERPRVRYHERLFDTHEDLFDALIEEFVDYADEQEFEPTFVMVQQLRYAKYESEHGPIYGDLMDRLDAKYDELTTIDMAAPLARRRRPRVAVRRTRGAATTVPETNAEIAQVLAAAVEERAVVK